MTWTETTDPGRGDGLREWEREDGAATIRLRTRPDGTWVVRLDRLYQAPEGSRYRRREAADRDEAMALVEEWRAEHGIED
jgi:hypothetical protein